MCLSLLRVSPVLIFKGEEEGVLHTEHFSCCGKSVTFFSMTLARLHDGVGHSKAEEDIQQPPLAALLNSDNIHFLLPRQEKTDPGIVPSLNLTQRYKHTHTDIQKKHVHARTHRHRKTRTHALTRECKHAHMHAHIQTHTHARAQLGPPPFLPQPPPSTPHTHMYAACIDK